MRFARKRRNPNVGPIDGGEGAGIRIDDAEEDEELVPNEPDDAFAVLDDEDDASPGDRRRDPLRRR